MKKDKSEILIFEKSKRGIIRMLFGRTGVVMLLLLIQVMILFSIFQFLGKLIPYAFGTFAIFSLVMVVHVINKEFNATVKITWVVLIMLLPAFGGLLYIFIQRDIGHRLIKKRMELILGESEQEFNNKTDLMAKLEKENKGLYNLGVYTGQIGGFPIYENTAIKYFPLGDDVFVEMIQQLERAEKFIFLEFFIIDEGYMWGRILKILADKVKEGVEVRVMYDGTCELTRLPNNYSNKLKQLGIDSKAFAPIRPFLSTHYNYRDHRKILVIDGRVAFTGGINLADEYINRKNIYGHWKDTAVMIEGEGVDSFTLMFLQMWNMDETYRNYMTDFYRAKALETPQKGYVLPFGDHPIDDDRVGQMIYMDMLNRAENYVYIMTPYLILDGEMVTALQFAAKRGVDVRVIVPHMPDKRLVFAQSQNYYRELIRAGVKIYEYTPGFVHGKMFLSDDRKAVVGTINLDYRSLYHHFECAVYMEDVPKIRNIAEDFDETLSQCQRVTMDDVKNHNIFAKIAGKISRLIAPLM